ncbi:hypothetical protein [Flaviaesturariibacter aridisoli]|uniref:Lipoprotein n=1 Tax=Flaviaesturariibacter aridisoli TaxID=2545761 RepID=A0A4R4DVJ6_9BACT|nr:hypothetical protein [Flaviaesturariibacter aridisoli]TCZ67340.1 hypothetical protein E0486_15660 [Flaviaesturariibacter aridisoli]
MKGFIGICCALTLLACNGQGKGGSTQNADSAGKQSNQSVKTAPPGTAESRQAVLDTARYDSLMRYVANGDTSGRWPVKNQPYPLPGAILPFYRPIAYYGNLYSNKMGALGKWPKAQMIPNLLEEVKKWNAADTVIKSIPSLHYIAVTAQGAPGKDGKYRYRMPLHQIDTILNWAKEINAIVFIDVQIGLSTLQDEIPLFEKFLSLPNVHLGIDPEFAMLGKGGKKPGSVIGTIDAADINWVGDYLASIVKKNNLPPKMFMVHRFTKGMVTNYDKIKLRPELQIIMDMDGWGPPDLKKGTYRYWINEQPVQWTGFKLFYVNDVEKSGQKEMMTREQVLGLKPKPVYIQYQ